MDTDIRQSHQRLLRRLLANYANKLASGLFFTVDLVLAYPHPADSARLFAAELPFSLDGHFDGTHGTVHDRIEKITAAITHPENHAVIGAKLVPGFVGLAMVANATFQSQALRTLSPQHVDTYLIAALVTLDDDDSMEFGTWHVRTGTMAFPAREDISDWDLDALIQLLYALDDLQNNMKLSGGGPIVLGLQEPPDDWARLELPETAKQVKRPPLSTI